MKVMATAAALVLAVPNGLLVHADVDTPEATNNAFVTGVTSTIPPTGGQPAESTASTSSTSTGYWQASTTCGLGGATVCFETARCPDGSIPTTWTYFTSAHVEVRSYTQCPGDPPPAEAVAVVTPGMVLEAFRRVPLPEAVLNVQPPGGETLVNLETGFHTIAAPFDRTVRLLGQEVTLHITPSEFDWSHGDGSSQRTDHPGRAWTESSQPDDPGLISHTYSSTDGVQVQLAVTWSATWQLNGGPTQPVPGTVTMTSTPQDLTILEARPHLVS